MLVLTRKVDERIVIAHSIEVAVLGIRGGKVRLGIDAPPEVPVLRKELMEQARPAASSNGHPLGL